MLQYAHTPAPHPCGLGIVSDQQTRFDQQAWFVQDRIAHDGTHDRKLPLDLEPAVFVVVGIDRSIGNNHNSNKPVSDVVDC